MSVRQTVIKQYQRLIAQWPQDALRPHTSIRPALESRLRRIKAATASPESTPSAASNSNGNSNGKSSSSSSSGSNNTSLASAAQKTPTATSTTPASPPTQAQAHPGPAPAPFSLQAEAEQARALIGLLDDRFMKATPYSDAVRHPRSNPQYYDKLLAELEAAPTRGWLAGLFVGWRHWFRLK